MSTAFPFVFVTSFCTLLIFHRLGRYVGLVDRPDARKHHQGVIPLVGGVSIFLTLAIAFLIFLELKSYAILFLSCAAVLVAAGVIDDRYDISFKVRLIIQTGVALVMMIVGNRGLHSLGDLLGNGSINLPIVSSYIITILGVIGAINAFNMVDGIDGLLGGLASVTFCALGYLFFINDKTNLTIICGLIITAIIPYVLLNLGFLGHRFKVFMGDAGSILIGFTVFWLLVEATQDISMSTVSARPVTALWIVAIPLMDMAAIMLRRIRKGHSPFKPDREHLHHICQRLGLSTKASLLVICSIAAIMASIGIWSDIERIPESVMFAIFLAIFMVYLFMISYIWRITTWLNKLSMR